MIKETSVYTNDFPVNIRIVKAEEYPLHFHQDIEFIYVLKGEINLKCGYFTYLLKEGDIFVINGREVHGLYQTGSSNIIALVQIDNYFFSHYFKRLSGSCYRTYTNDPNDSRFDCLKLFFGNILSNSLKKEPGYKHLIIDQVNQLIEYLNKYFHSFTFEDKVVVSSRSSNPVFIDRLSRIIHYIYEHHAEKLTLEDLSRQEHLSTFYLSHLITEGTGMNFREFLCFARVEFSEMLLLDTGKRVNVIAKEVGFSTTAYYIRYFQKWFGLTPEDYRKKYMNVIQTSGIPAKLHQVEPDVVLKLLRSSQEALNKQYPDTNQAGDLRLDIQLDCNSPSLRSCALSMVPRCSVSVLEKHVETILELSRKLSFKEIQIMMESRTKPDKNHVPVGELQEQASRLQELTQRLEYEGIPYRLQYESKKKEKCFGLDSIAANPYILKMGLSPQCSELAVNSLIDEAYEPEESPDNPNKPAKLLDGGDGMLTADLIPKPSYFAYLALQMMEGDLIHWGKYHAITRQPGNQKKGDSFCILVFNQNEDTENLCRRASSMEEAIDKINGFDDVLDMGIRINGLKGSYQIMKYRINKENCLLSYAAKSGISSRMPRHGKTLLTWLASPKIDTSMEEVNGSLFVNVSLKGLESECIMITPT